VEEMELLKTEKRQILESYGIVAVYLFGSRAMGGVQTHSDFDLAVLFGNHHPDKHNLTLRLVLAEELSQRLGEQVDLIFLQGAPIFMRYEIITTGRVMFCMDDVFRTDFEDIVYRDYLDFKPFMDQFYKEEAEAIRDGYFFAEH